MALMKTPNFINVIIKKTGSNAKSNGLSASGPVLFALIFSSCRLCRAGYRERP